MALFDEKNEVDDDLQNGFPGDQVIKTTKIGLPVEIEIPSLDEKIKISSVSPFFLDIVQKHVIDCIKKAATEHSEISDQIDKYRQSINETAKTLGANEKETDAKKLKKLAKVEELYTAVIDKRYEIVRGQIMSDVKNYAPVLQLIWLNNKNKNWWKDCDGMPDEKTLNDALSFEAISKVVTFEEAYEIMKIFFQKNDAKSVRGVFFGLAGLTSTALPQKDS